MNALLFAAAAAATAATDSQSDYSHVFPLAVSGRPGVVQLQLPRDAYLHARSAYLNDLRIFDAAGVAQPFAMRPPDAEVSDSHQARLVRIFPLMAERADTPLAGLEVSTARDGRVLSVRLPGPQSASVPGHPRERLAGLVLDLRQDGGAEPLLVDALHFTLPAGRNSYNAQVVLEVSEDLKRWETVGVADLSWLTNASEETLANDKLEFPARLVRYARLSWRSGEPLQFAAIKAQSLPHGTAPAAGESLLLRPEPGREARDLQYTRPAAITPTRIGLHLEGGNVVLPVIIGSYREGHRSGRRDFDPALRATFFRLDQDGELRQSGAIAAPQWLGERLVLRFDQPPKMKPMLRISWQPATLIFVAGGTPPYTLAVGRDKAAPVARAVADVAPGFTKSELLALASAKTGPAQEQAEVLARAARQASADNSAAQRRLMVLWGVLVLGVAVVAGMVWRLLRQANSP
jgi:hypothetical protein